LIDIVIRLYLIIFVYYIEVNYDYD